MSAGSCKVVCHRGDCIPCQLCLKVISKMRPPGQMKEHAQFKVVYAWLKLEKPTINESDCICWPCGKQIQRNHDNPHFTPRWLPKPPILPKKCNMEHCQAMVDTQAVVTVDELENILNERVKAFTVSTSKQSIGLCRKHSMYIHCIFI